ncbi:MAG: hypothetical protein QOC70_2414 [Verrucomicrobiota bacterium]|jgi:hypothetical protein
MTGLGSSFGFPPKGFDIRHSTFVISDSMNITKLSGRVRRTLLVAAFAGVLVCAGSLVAGGDDQAIIAGTKKYLAAESYTAAVKITVEKVEGDYARVLVTPSDNQTDPALVFLKRERGVWHGLTIGTGWDPEDLAKLHIPASLRP